jgi:uncharacterized protein with GYD domain
MYHVSDHVLTLLLYGPRASSTEKYVFNSNFSEQSQAGIRQKVRRKRATCQQFKEISLKVRYEVFMTVEIKFLRAGDGSNRLP